MALDPRLQRVEAALGEIARLVGSPKGYALRGARAGVQLPPVAQRILHRAAEHGPARISELARATGTGDAAVSRQVTLLEQRGLARRDTDPADGRAAVVNITPAGRRAGRKLRAAQDEIFRELLASWSTRDLDQLADLIERLIEDLRL